VGSTGTAATPTTPHRKAARTRQASSKQRALQAQDWRQVQGPAQVRRLRGSTVYYWLGRWSEEGVWEKMFQALLGMLEKEGKLDLKEGALDGSFVPAKRGAKRLITDAKAKAPP
jgi:hypothetical protein